MKHKKSDLGNNHKVDPTRHINEITQIFKNIDETFDRIIHKQ